MTPDGYEPRDDLGEQAWTDLLARGSREGFGPALLDLLREAEDRGIERAARFFEDRAVSMASNGCASGVIRIAPSLLRALKGGGR